MFAAPDDDNESDPHFQPESALLLRSDEAKRGFRNEEHETPGGIANHREKAEMTSPVHIGARDYLLLTDD